MDTRYGAWAQIITLTRLLYDGGGHGLWRLPPRHGGLFDPDAFPFLEGRPWESKRAATALIEPPLVSDGILFRIVQDLLYLEGERISYRALDVDTEKLTLAALEKAFESARARRVGEAVERKLQSAAPQDVADLLPHLQTRASIVTAAAKEILGNRGRQEAEAMRRIIEDQRKRILAKKNEAQLTLGFDKMELSQLEEERKDWDKRLMAIGHEVDEEPARILKSYEVQAHRVEPIGVVYLWPISG